METLKLRNLINLYEKINKGKKKEMFYNSINNNLILFNPYDKGTDTDSICNSIRDKAYLYLINELNTNHNLVVYWSQCEGTTSDYTIYYDLDVNDLKNKNYKDIVAILNNQPNIIGYKYIKVINNEAIKLEKETIELDQ